MSSRVGKKPKSIFFKIVIGFIIFLIVIVAIAVIGFIYLKNALGIDLFDIKRKIDLINRSPVVSSIVTNSYSEEDAYQAFYKIYGSDEVYKYDENNKGVFDIDKFISLAMITDTTLTDKQLCGLASVFMKNCLKESNMEGYEYYSLEQIKFSNFEETTETIKLNINVVLKLDLTLIKNQVDSETSAAVDFVFKFVPSKFYFTNSFDITVDKNNLLSITINNNLIRINNLSVSQSKEIFDMFNKFFSSDNSLIENELHQNIVNLLFENNAQNKGVLYSINEVLSFNFEKDNEIILISLKKA